MSVGARTSTSGSATSGARGASPVAADTAGRLLARLSVLPVLLVTAWLLAGLPLLLAHHFAPVPTLVVAVPLAVILVVLGLWWIPGLSRIGGRWPDALPAGAPEPAPAAEPDSTAEPAPAAPARTPWWAVAGVVVVAVAFGVDQMIYHTQQILVMRDPASYLNFGYWIAHHGSLPIPQSRAAFGASHIGLSFGTSAFYQVGRTIVPQFMAGLPMILAPAFWAGGVAAAIGMGPVLGACGLLVFGGLAARLVGPRWAPLATLVLALSLPDEFTGRATYSEPVAQILFLGGLCLVIDALDRDGMAARVLGSLAGLALGLTLLVRIDGASDILPVVPYIGLLLIGRRRQALPLLGGLVVGGGYGLVDGLLLSRPYLTSIKSSLEPLALLTGLVIIVTLLVMAWRWERGVPEVRGRWLANGITVLTFVVVAGFALRPYVETVRAPTDLTTKGVMARFQRGNHLPVDPTRTYAELSLHWVFWYIGVPAVLLAAIAVAVLSRKCLRGQAPTWTLPLVAFAWAIVTFLYRPAITPDQPWGSRRLVPSVLPGFILLAVWATGWLVGRLRRMGTGPGLRGVLAACLVLLLLVPTAITTFGLKVRSGGPVGVKVAAVGLAFKTSYQGEISAVNGMCAAIPPGSSVLFISGGIAGRLAQVVRGMCGDPVAEIRHPRFATVEQDVQSIVRAGRRPVLLASTRSQLVRFGGPDRRIMALHSTWDAHTLTTPPLNPWPFSLIVWMSEPRP
jgi:hypothetical protein